MGFFIECRTVTNHRIAFMPHDVRQVTEFPDVGGKPSCQVITSTGPSILSDSYDEVMKKIRDAAGDMGAP
jgi:hypothetical protein